MWGLEKSMQQAWARRMFDHRQMATTDGKPIRLLNTGNWNHDQGPDFLGGQIVLDGTELHGDIELHLDSRDWFKHGHHQDPNYDSVMLHVVMDGSPCLAVRADGSLVPTMTLEGRVPENLFGLAKDMSQSKTSLLCESTAKKYPPELVKGLLEQHGISRVKDKLERVQRALLAVNQDWEEALWGELLPMLAGPVNAAAFRELAARVPFRIMRRYVRSTLASEALLFGVGGLLESPKEDEYQLRLAEEWKFLSRKHALDFQYLPLRLHRMRPASFPKVRLSQTMALLAQFPVLMDLMGMKGFEALKKAEISAGDYWKQNRDFGSSSTVGEKQLGLDHKMALAINVLLPFGAAYLGHHGQADALKTYVDWLMRLPPEKNKITQKYASVGWKADSAFHSQAMIHLDRTGCSAFGCLGCPVWSHKSG